MARSTYPSMADPRVIFPCCHTFTQVAIELTIKNQKLFISRAKLSIFALCSLNFNDFDADMSHEGINNSTAFKLKWIFFPRVFQIV